MEGKERAVAKRAGMRQEWMARERLAEMGMGERREAMRRGWRDLRETAERKVEEEEKKGCIHVRFGWGRRKGS